MENKDLLKYGAIIGGGGIAIWALLKATKFTDAADKLTINITKFDIGLSNNKELKFSLDLEFVNPSKQPISLSIPSIKPYYGQSELGYSMPMKDSIVINPASTNKISNIQILVPALNLVSAGVITDIFQLISKLNTLIETLKQKVSFKIYAIVNGIEVNIEQRFGEEAKELGYVDESGELGEIGLVAAGRRNIKDGKEFEHLFSKPDGTDDIVENDGSVEDTVKWCGWVVRTYHKDVEKLAKYLDSKSKNEKDLYKNIFDFCYNHIQYHLDRQGVEQLRRPARTWVDRKQGVDCDDFTMFIASILYNLDKPFEFRITKYNKPNYQHIYLIVPVSDGVYITIDPVLDKFNYEKPYSFKRDFTMKQLNLAGNGTEMGIPIEILAGTDIDDDLLKVVIGEDLKDTINGLGSAEDDDAAMLRYLKRLRNVYVKNPDYISDYQNPTQAVEMLDYAIKYWNTPKREEAIAKLTAIEDKLIARGDIRLDGIDDDDDEEEWEEDISFSGVEAELDGYEYKYEDEGDDWEEDVGFTGIEGEVPGYEYKYEEPEWEEDFGFTGNDPEDPEYIYDYSVDGLAGRRRRKKRRRKPLKRFVRKIKAKRTKAKTRRRLKRKKKGGLFRRIGKGVKKGFKKAARGIMKVSAAPMRLAFLAAMRTNAGKVADKLKYAYLSEQKAIAMGIDRNEYRKLKKAHAKVEQLFFKMGGNKSALKKAILSGKRKNLRGFQQLDSGLGLLGIHELDGFEIDLGYSGSEPENPSYEYKYDNQVWEVDEDFSGFEPEEHEYDYDYSFDGLDGKVLRLRRRKKAKFRFKRHKNRIRRMVQKTGVRKILSQVEYWLKDVDTKQIEKEQHKVQQKQAFLKALACNYHNISVILAYGYDSENQIKEEGINTSDWQKIKQALENTKQLFKKEFKGNDAALKKAILLGRDKPSLSGLGAVVAAAGAVTGLIGKIVGWIKDIRLKKKASREAKQQFVQSGGSKKDWRKTGKKRFTNQYKSTQSEINQQNTENATTSSSNQDYSQIISNHLKSGSVDTGINPMQFISQGVVPSANSMSASITPVSYNSAQNAGGVKESVFKQFWKKHKKKVFIGGGLLGAGTLAYFLLKDKDKKPQSNAQMNKGIQGTKTKKPKKTVKEVKLT